MKFNYTLYKILFLLLFFTQNFLGSINSSTDTTADFQLTAFQELLTVSSTPYNQLKFIYGISSFYAKTGASGSGAITATGGFAQLDSGTGSTGSVNVRSKNRLIYNPGQGSAAVFSAVFPHQGVTGSYQTIGIGNNEDGFFFGYTGTQFGILWRSSSSGTPIDTWIPQTGWNVDTMNGTGPSQMTLDTTKGNVFKVQYQWLGFGAVRFYIENPTGAMQLVHMLQYANANTSTTIRNPALQLRAEVVNFTGTTTGAQIKTPCMVGLSEGNPGVALNVRNSQEAQNITVNGTLTHLMTIHNKQTYQGRTNQVMTFPDLVSIQTTTNSNNDGIYYIYLNPTFSTTGTFTDVDTNNSVMDYSIGTNSTVSSNGQLLGVLYTQNVESVLYSLVTNNIVLAPNDYLSILGIKLGGTVIAYLSLSWTERF